MIRFKDPESFAVIEPRVTHIAHELERLLSLVEFEKDGQPVAVNGFRLRELAQWRDYTTNTAMNALTPISGVCNSTCSFCFEEGLPYPREKSLMSVEEARTRLKYYSPDTGMSLFPSNRPHMETFIHPNAIDIIEMARQREPERLFWITSNGSHFTEANVQRLAALKPIIFKLSLNASNPELNQELMQTGKRTQIAIDAPRMLNKYRIPFMGSIVAWPTMSLDDIEETVRYLESYNAYAVRIRLPLSHKFLKIQTDFDFNSHWERVAQFAQELRFKLSVPLFVEPPIYWVNPIVPEVDGVVQNSPAFRAGVRCGDVIQSINAQAIKTRIESEATLDQLHVAGESVSLVVRRGEQELQFELVDLPQSTDTYPYNRDYFYRGENYGIFHVEDFRLKDIQEMFDTIDRYGATDVMLFTSAIVAPIFETLVNSIPDFAEPLARVNLYIEIIKDNTAGGNYDVMDSRFVEDYARVIRKRLKGGAKIDLILIPDAFGSPWGVDLTGASQTELAMEFGVPVELISWLLVYGREV